MHYSKSGFGYYVNEIKEKSRVNLLMIIQNQGNLPNKISITGYCLELPVFTLPEGKSGFGYYRIKVR